MFTSHILAQNPPILCQILTFMLHSDNSNSKLNHSKSSAHINN
jgi:hypothetical protein